jgi:hypothetical protein
VQKRTDIRPDYGHDSNWIKGRTARVLQFSKLPFDTTFYLKTIHRRFNRKREDFMRINLKQCAWIGVLTLGIGISGGAARVVASPKQEQHEPDYSKNKNYQQGMREGRDDSAHNRDHYKKHHFKKDEDQKAYEAGYQGSHHK